MSFPSVLDDTGPTGWTPTVPPPAPVREPHHCQAMDDLVDARTDMLMATALRAFAFDFHQWWRRQLREKQNAQIRAARKQAELAAMQSDGSPA